MLAARRADHAPMRPAEASGGTQRRLEATMAFTLSRTPGLRPTSLPSRNLLTTTTALLQPRIDGLALQGENAEYALVNPPERFSLDEALEPFDPQRELTQRQRSFTR